MSRIVKSRKASSVLSVFLSLAILLVLVVYVFPMERNSSSDAEKPRETSPNVVENLMLPDGSSDPGFGVIAVPEPEAATPSMPDVFSTSAQQAPLAEEVPADGQIPPEFTQALERVPTELPADLKAQLEGPPPELPEDIKRALQIPPRVVSIEEVNNPNFKPGDEGKQAIWPQPFPTPEGWGLMPPEAIATPEILDDDLELEESSDE